MNFIPGPFSTPHILTHPSSIPRLVAQGTLTYPMFTITLQRDSVDICRNMGAMSLGELPGGVKNDSLTWVKVRGYTTAEGLLRLILPGIYTLSHGRCQSMMIGRMGRYCLHRVFPLRIFLCWDWLILRVYLFTFPLLGLLINFYISLCCRVPRPTESDHSRSIGWRDTFWVLVEALGPKTKPLGLYLGGVYTSPSQTFRFIFCMPLRKTRLNLN